MQTNLKRPTNTTSLIGTMLVFMIALTGAALANFPQPELTGPSGSPAFPQSFSAFDVSGVVSNYSANAGAPRIAEWMRSNGQGDTMALAGERLSAYQGLAAGRDTHFVFYGQEGATQVLDQGKVQRLDGREVAITLPAGLPADQLYLMWPRNAAGYGAPVAINKADAWWTGFDRVAPGGTFSVFGRDLALGAGKCHLYIEELGRWLTSATSNPYKAEFEMPLDVPVGDYSLWVHNGRGREYGWAKADGVSVVSETIWSGPVFNVKDYGAKGDGVANDSQAISAAFSAADQVDYSTVYLPAGTYAHSGFFPLYNRTKVRLLGAGMELTKIKPHSSHATSSNKDYMIFNCGSDIKVQDLTLAPNAYGGDRMFRIRSQDRVECERVRFSQLESPNANTSLEAIDTHYATYIRFKDCEFILSGAVFLGKGEQLQLDGCHFRGLQDNNTLMASWGGEKISIENCTARSYDDSNVNDGFGWCKGRFFHAMGQWGATQEIYFGGNSTTNMSPRPAAGVDQNSGEQFMSEGENIRWRGAPSSVSASAITLPGFGSGSGDLLTVVSGTGMGQTREVLSAAGGVVTVDEPWHVRPDASSVIVVGTYTRRMVVYDNYFEGAKRAVTSGTHSATTAVEPYGGAIDWIVDGNIMKDLRYSVQQFSIFKDRTEGVDAYVSMPHFFNRYTDNVIDGCRAGINIMVIKEPRYPYGALGDPSYFGVLYRDNEIKNAVSSALQTSAGGVSEAKFAMTVFERNQIQTESKCVIEASGQENHIWIDNSFTGNGSGNGMEIGSGHVPALIGNEWAAFSNPYAGSTPGAVLELPKRTIGLSDADPSSPVRVNNAGTAPMSWSATSSEPWISVSGTSGAVVGEEAAGQFTVRVDSALVPAATAEAVVDIETTDGQVKQLTVIYSADGIDPFPPVEPPPAPLLTGIAISGPSFINEGATARFYCSATYSDGSSAQVTPTWSENSTFASIAQDGLLTAADVASDQSVTVSASFEGETASLTSQIRYLPDTIDRIEIIGPTELNEQTSVQLSCMAFYTDGSSAAVTPLWSENSGAAGIDAAGLFTGKNVTRDISVMVTASFDGKTDTHAIVVKYVPPGLTALTILGPFSLDEGSSAQYSCVGTYADGSTATVSPVWSENSAITTISGSGLLTAGEISADQSVLISASLDGISVIQAVTIRYLAPVVSNIQIAGPSSVAEESSAQYTCEAVYSDGSRTPIAASWNVSGSAAISSIGLLTTGNVGSDQTATITASYNGKSDDLSVTIQYVAPALTGVAVSGPRFVDEGLTASYNCVATYSDGTIQAVVPGWSLVSPFASVNASGLLMANDVFEDQDVQLVADFGGFQVNYLVTVKYVAPPVTLTELRITAPSSLEEITETTVSCVAIYSDGSTDSVTPAWSVDAAFASIDAAGALNVGNIDENSLVNVTATYSGVTETIAIDVSAVGTKAIYPLTGLEGKTVRARLWDEIGQTWHELGEMESPVELVVENVTSGQWYWLSIEEYDAAASDWILVHANWISM